MTEYNRTEQTRIEKLLAEIERLELEIVAWKQACDLKNDLLKRMQVALNEARGPDGHTHERVAEWLRGQGYIVTKNEPELRYFGEIPL
jgi:hypothetical protein